MLSMYSYSAKACAGKSTNVLLKNNETIRKSENNWFDLIVVQL
jgi:hypothetical protein